GFDEGLVRRQVGGPLDVAQPDVGVDAFEQLAQSCADSARCAGDQNRLHAVPIAVGERKFQLAAAELDREPLIALATADEMTAHRRARLQNSAVADRLHDGAVLALERFAVGALADPGPAANRLPRDDDASEMFQKAPELRVSGRIRDAAMERKILRDRVLAALERGADGIEALDDPAHLRRRAAF